MEKKTTIIIAIGIVAVVAVAGAAILLTSGFDHEGKIINPDVSADDLNIEAKDLGRGWEESYLLSIVSGSIDNSYRHFFNDDYGRLAVSIAIYGDVAEAKAEYDEIKSYFSSTTNISKCQNGFKAMNFEVSSNVGSGIVGAISESTYVFQDLNVVVEIHVSNNVSNSLVNKVMSILEKNIHNNAILVSDLPK